MAPFKVMGNIHYVGTLDLSSFLITSPAGHVLIDTGVEANAEAILANIKALGFNVKDIRVMLTTQAHYDHVAAFARLKAGIRRAGARLGGGRAAGRGRRQGRLPVRARVLLSCRRRWTRR